MPTPKIRGGEPVPLDCLVKQPGHGGDMREIKFRAWDKEGKFMTDPFSLGSVNAGDGYDHEWEVLQFTGLNDRTGQEIYEGDILRDVHGVTVVWWNGDVGAWAVNDEDDCAVWLGDCHAAIDIIGNVHEHPELVPDV